MKLIALIAAVSICGCASRVVDPMPHRTAQQLAPLPEDWGTANSAQMSRSLVTPPVKPLYLVWDNNNSNQQWPALQCEIYSTTNLLQSFQLYARVSAWTNLLLYPTNQQEYFKARFFDPVSGLTSEWSHQ